MLLPGDNYSEQLMFTLEGYRETWVDGRAATLYGETLSALDKARQISNHITPQVSGGKAGVPPPCRVERCSLSPRCKGEGRASQPFSQIWDKGFGFQV